jgi:hypothetical protein
LSPLTMIVARVSIAAERNLSSEGSSQTGWDNGSGSHTS